MGNLKFTEHKKYCLDNVIHDLTQKAFEFRLVWLQILYHFIWFYDVLEGKKKHAPSNVSDSLLESIYNIVLGVA